MLLDILVNVATKSVAVIAEKPKQMVQSVTVITENALQAANLPGGENSVNIIAAFVMAQTATERMDPVNMDALKDTRENFAQKVIKDICS